MKLTENDKIFILLNKDRMKIRSIAEQLGCSRQAIWLFRKRFDNRKSIINLPPPGRKNKINSYYEKKIISLIKRGKSLEEIRRNISISICRQTLVKILKKNGYFYLKKKVKPRLFPDHISKRLRFARDEQSITQREVDKLIFLDECSIETFRNYRQYQWRKKGCSINEGNYVKVNPCYIKKYKKFIAMISKDGPIYFKDVTDWNSRTFISHINDWLVNYHGQEMIDDGYSLVMDGDTCHYSAYSRRFFNRKHVQVKILPPRSCDINLIEHCFSYFKYRLMKNHLTRSIDELIVKSTQCFMEEIPIRIISNLYLSYKKRMDAIIVNNGSITKYT